MLPYSVTPIHPGRMWCHTRLVYLPMGYLYGRRFQAEEDDLIRQLRKVVAFEDSRQGTLRDSF